MSDNPKCFLHGTVIEITTSTQEGLPFVANEYMRVIIEGALAAAQTLYPIVICHVMVLANHLHLLAIVNDPADVASFMGYFKTEVAHAVNQLFGWKGKSLWVAGYDSPVILSPEKLLDRMMYLYLNPVEAGTQTVAEYPNINSYDALVAGGSTKRCKKVARDAVPELPTRTLSLREQHELAKSLENGPGIEYELKIEPWAWLECFEASKGLDKDKILDSFLENLKSEEARIGRERKTPVISPHALRLQDPRKPYRSKRDGKKMICLSHSREQRKGYIAWFKSQRDLARDAIKNWRAGILSSLPPPGFFLPGGILLANAVFVL